MIGYLSGAIGGVLKMYSAPTFISLFMSQFLQINTVITRGIETALAAIVCGYLGAAGKHLFTWSLKKINSKKIK